MIFIEHINESYVRLKADPGIIHEIGDRFKFLVEGYKFMPAYKCGMFDGYIRFFNYKTNYFPKGLVPELIDFAEEQGYKVKLDPDFIRFTEEIELDIESLILPFGLYDYQEESIERALKKKRQTILASTGSGKSLIIYVIMRMMIRANKKLLIIVPTISLVSQLFSDFDDYAIDDPSFSAIDYVHQMGDGRVKSNDSPVILSTWQSLQRLPQSFFEVFEMVICDEVHVAKADQLTSILNKCINAFYRLGLTGTLDDSLANEMTIKSLFGPVHRVTDTKDLMDRGILSEIEVNAIVLRHKAQVPPNLTYAQEMDYLVRHTARNNLITGFIGSLPGNSLVLFQYVEKHGKVLEKLLIEVAKKTNKELYFVYGGTDSEDREKIRKLAEKKNNIIICALLPVFSAGVNIKNLHNVIFASSTKSKIRVLQSVGRGLRLHETKDKMRLYDFADDLRGNSKKMNHALRHFMNRLEMYQKERFPVKITQLDL